MHLQEKRNAFKPCLPVILRKMAFLESEKGDFQELSGKHANALKDIFPNTFYQPLIHFKEGSVLQERAPLKIGVVFSGGPASGGHNVLAGLHDAMKSLNKESELIGFLNGPRGIINDEFILLDEEVLAPYRNTGGFRLIGTGRDKIEKEEDFINAEKTVLSHKLDGLVIIGGDDSNTNAAMLAEYFITNEVPCRVIGVPKTIDGDLKNQYIEKSFGFDTATKTYSEIVGNVCSDAQSQKKYQFFIKLMGRSASHIVLETVLRTHANYALIGEEIASLKKPFHEIIQELADIVTTRAIQGKNYGVYLIPEGIIEFIPEFKTLVNELNQLLSPDKAYQEQLEQIAKKEERMQFISSHLTEGSKKAFDSIPEDIRYQMLLKRDSHGNVPVSQIESEKLIIEAVKKALEEKEDYKETFNPQPLFCGYEGRSGYPTNFDAEYCYALGHVATLLIDSGVTGYMACIRGLDKPAEEWEPLGTPLVPMMTIEQRQGRAKPVIKKALVDLNTEPFTTYREKRNSWAINDDYRYPGPIQFF